ncbi:MAG TPA: hypothetical protein VH519_05240 [Hyphomicrobiaceae bacterium]|jgi:hypothetical protein
MSTKALNRSLAKQDPEGTFDSPFGIVNEQLFTRGEKLATLNRWRLSILEELIALGEGKRARLLDEIDEARSRLRTG